MMNKKYLLYFKEQSVKLIKLLKRNKLIIIFIFLYLIFSLFTYKDFGITADEELEYYLGRTLISYYSENKLYQENSLLIQKPYLKSYYHIYPMILSILNYKGYYEWFHLLNLLFGTTIFIFGYIFFNKIYNNKYYSILFCLLLITTPRFLGHLPANPKDIPFAVMYFISFGLLYLINKSTSKEYLTIIGIFLGLTLGLRIVGYTLFIIFFANIYFKKTKIKKVHLNQFLILLFSSHLILLITWPYISQNPLNIINVITNASNFAPWNREILFMGEFINKNQRPWFYLPIYLLITTPVFLIATHFLSFIYSKKNNLLKSLLFTIYLNIFLYFLINPVIYNGLRHFLFLIPLIVATSTIVIVSIYNSNIKFRKSIILIITAYILFMFTEIYKIHPYQYTYFNIPSRYLININDNFEVDYWGSSYKEATEKLINYLDKNNIEMPNVYACNVDYAVRYYSNAKFEIVGSSKNADFIICDYQNNLIEGYNQEIILNVTRGNVIYNFVRSNY